MRTLTLSVAMPIFMLLMTVACGSRQADKPSPQAVVKNPSSPGCRAQGESCLKGDATTCAPYWDAVAQQLLKSGSAAACKVSSEQITARGDSTKCPGYSRDCTDGDLDACTQYWERCNPPPAEPPGPCCSEGFTPTAHCLRRCSKSCRRHIDNEEQFDECRRDCIADCIGG